MGILPGASRRKSNSVRYPKKKKKVTFRQIWYRKLSSVFHRLQGCKSERKMQNLLFTLKSNRVTLWEGYIGGGMH